MKALSVQLSRSLEIGRLSAAEAVQLAGRQQFASAQVFGICRTAVPLAPIGPPLLLFTDGFCEGEGSEVTAGIGAVLLDPEDGFAEAFGALIPPPLMEVIREDTKDQVVAQAELLPLLAARVKWPHKFRRSGGTKCPQLRGQ